MTVHEDVLNKEDIYRLGRLQSECLPLSTFSSLGAGFAREAYRFFERSPHERVFPKRVDGRVECVAVFSFKRQSLAKRLLLNTDFVFRAPYYLWRRDIRRRFLERPVVTSPEVPELLILFTDPGRRSQGLGGSLIEECEKVIRRDGHHRYIVHTADEPQGGAYKFYMKQGFERDTVETPGRSCLLSKRL